MDLGLSGRNLVVTGGSQGLGFATAKALVTEGASVAVVSRARDHVDAAVAALEDLGAAGRVTGIAVDLTDDDAPARILDAATERLGPLDGAFVSHGGPPAGPAADLDDDDLDTALDLAARAPIRFVRELVGRLDEGGAVVVLTSSSSVQPIPGLASSNVARPAVWGYCKTLATELGPRGIRCNVLLPGRFATGRVAALDEARAQREDTTVAEVRARHEAGVPLRRLGDPDELGRVAAFLLSPAASYVTGAAWAVDGGVIQGL